MRTCSVWSTSATSEVESRGSAVKTGASPVAGRYKLKTAMESSVWSKDSQLRGMQPEPGRYFSVTGCTRHGYAAAMSRFGARSVLPGVQPSTYRTAGFSCEHGNPDPSAGHTKPGKPTGLVTSRTGGGASVVVGARESRAHGEGRQ